MKENLKELLKDGCVVELRNQEKALIIDGYLCGRDFWFHESDYDKGLEHTALRNLDIMKVYSRIFTLEKFYQEEKLNLIWKRLPKKMTREEIEAALGYEIEIME